MITVSADEIRKHIKDIRFSIENDIKPSIWDENSGFFAFVRSFFSYIDYLGHLCFGELDDDGNIKKNQSTKCSERYIELFFGGQYVKLAPLLLDMYRHGTIHQFAPKYILLPSEKTIRFMLNHSKIMNHDGEEYQHLHYKNDFLPFSLDAAYEDLLRSLDRMEKALEEEFNGSYAEAHSYYENFSSIYQALKNGIGYGFLKKEVKVAIDEMIEQSNTKKEMKIHPNTIQRLQRAGGFWFPVFKRNLDRTYQYLSIGYRLNKAIDRRLLGGAWVSELYQFISLGGGLIWVALIKLPVLTGLVWRGFGATVAFYRLFEILLFSLRWLVIEKAPVESHRRSLAGFALNLCEVGLFFAIAYLLLGWFDPPMSNYEALFSSVSGVFMLEYFSKIKSGLWPQLFMGVKIVTSWILVVLILGNVVGKISRGEKDRS